MPARSLVLTIDPVSDGSLVLSCRALGRSLDTCVAVLLEASGKSARLPAGDLEDLLRARSEAETWMSRAGQRRASQEPIWFLMWEHETFALLNRIKADRILQFNPEKTDLGTASGEPAS
jgi:hypothetical protein